MMENTELLTSPLSFDEVVEKLKGYDTEAVYKTHKNGKFFCHCRIFFMIGYNEITKLFKIKRLPLSYTIREVRDLDGTLYQTFVNEDILQDIRGVINDLFLLGYKVTNLV